MVIAIDGPAASGKGTLARRLAAHYGLPHLDTGLLYRAVARARSVEDRVRSVGGQVYGDMILIQANLLPHDADPGTNPTPQSLATELVAFLTDTHLQDSTVQPHVQVTTTSNVPATTTTTGTTSRAPPRSRGTARSW